MASSTSTVDTSTFISFVASFLLIGGTVYLFRSNRVAPNAGGAGNNKGKKKRVSKAAGAGAGSGKKVIGGFDSLDEVSGGGEKEKGGLKKEKKNNKKEKRVPTPTVVLPPVSPSSTSSKPKAPTLSRSSSSRDPSDMLLDLPSDSDQDENSSASPSSNSTSKKSKSKPKQAKGKAITLQVPTVLPPPSSSSSSAPAASASAAKNLDFTSSAGEWETGSETEGGWSKVPDRKTRTPTPTPLISTSSTTVEPRVVPGAAPAQTKRQRQNAAKRQGVKDAKIEAEAERIKILNQHRSNRQDEGKKVVNIKSVPASSSAKKEVGGGMKAGVDSESGLLIWD